MVERAMVKTKLFTFDAMGAAIYGIGFQTLIIITFFLNGIGICTINIKILGGNLQSILTGNRTEFEW